MTLRHLSGSLALACGLALTSPALAAESNTPAAKTEHKHAKSKPAGKHAWKDEKHVREHLASHVKFPATKADLLKACNDFSDAAAEDKKWFTDTLPDGTYASADDVLKALGMTATTAK